MPRPLIAALRTTPRAVLEDYGRLMRLAAYRSVIDPSIPTILKLNLSWTKYFPACSSQPWQVEGVVKTMREDGYAGELDRLVARAAVPIPGKGRPTTAGCRSSIGTASSSPPCPKCPGRSSSSDPPSSG